MSLYQTYRPLVFADIAGQEHIKTTLQNELARGTTVHAYLFSGPRAVGKTTTARILVRALNCEKLLDGMSEPCNQCQNCSQILQGRTLDIIEIDAASHTGVDNVRENIIAAARVANTALRVKAFIIDEAHMLSVSAFNALLKLLEEPPKNVVFILATTELHKVPATVVSRCQRFDFKKIPPAEMEKRLKKIIQSEKKIIDDEVLAEVIRLSDGCQRDAESMLGQLLSLHEKKIGMDIARTVLPFSHHALVHDLAKAFLVKEKRTALGIIGRLTEEGVDHAYFLDQFVEYFRTLLFLKGGAGDLLELQKNELAIRETLAASIDEARLLNLLEDLLAAQRDMRFFHLPQLPLEIAALKACRETV